VERDEGLFLSGGQPLRVPQRIGRDLHPESRVGEMRERAPGFTDMGTLRCDECGEELPKSASRSTRSRKRTHPPSRFVFVASSAAGVRDGKIDVYSLTLVGFSRIMERYVDR